MNTNVCCIIPTIGRPELRRAVVSVLAQSLPVVPIVLLDRKASLSKVNLILANLNVTAIQTNLEGVSAIRNFGLAMNAGKIVTFLDDDDFWISTKIETQIREMQESTPLGFVSSGAIVIYPNLVRIRPNNFISHKSNFRDVWYGFAWTRSRYYVPVGSWLFYGEQVSNLHFNAMELREDLDLIFRTKFQHIKQVEKPLVIINSSPSRAANRETLKNGISWFRILSISSKLNALKFFLGEFLRSQIFRFFKRVRFEE